MLRLVASCSKMSKLISLKLSQKHEHLQKIVQLSQPNAEIRRSINQLMPIGHLFEELVEVKNSIQNCLNTLRSEKDNQMIQLCKDEMNALNKRKQQIEEESLEYLLQKEPYQDCNCITMSFMPGVGGTEAGLFAQDLMHMYEGYLQGRGFMISQYYTSYDDSRKSLKQGQFKVKGQGVYADMICQSGSHKVIRVPATESKGRLHSSTAVVVVLPQVPDSFSIGQKDIRYQFMRSSGAGGQSVNKTESACRAIHIPSGLSVHIQQERNQDQNKKRATEILKQRVFAIHYQKLLQERSNKRKSQVGNKERSDKIRTYNFAQDRISDHRLGTNLSGMKRMLKGQYLDDLIAEFKKQQKADRLQAFLSQEI